MIQIKNKNRSTRFIWILGGLLTAVILVGNVVFMGFFTQYQTEEAVYSLTKFYLEELAERRTDVIEANLNERKLQMEAAVRGIAVDDLEDEETLREYLAFVQTFNSLDMFAMVDEDGMVYTATSTYAGISRFGFLSEKVTEPMITVNQIYGNKNMVIIAAPVEKVFFQGKAITSCFSGINMDNILNSISLQTEKNQTYCNIFYRDGQFLTKTEFGKLTSMDNILTFLEEEAEFDDGYSMNEIRKNLEKGREGFTSFTNTGFHDYLYYKPIGGTDWYLAIFINENIIHERIEDIRRNLITAGVIQIVIITIVMVGIFYVIYRIIRSKEKIQYEKLNAEAANTAKTVFLNNMSHDIRTPMNAILGFTNLAITHMKQPEQVKDYLEKIMTSGNHLLALINDVLDMSRIESGKVQIITAECYLPDIIQDIENIIWGDVGEKQLTLNVDISDVRDPYIMCDKLRLNQVLLNCLSNAVKFTPSGGNVSVIVNQEESEREGFSEFHFVIRDTGIGMSREFLKHLFEPFERERTSTVSGIGGTGLGMTITRELVEMMGGSISVASEKGKGTEVFISLSFALCDKKPEEKTSVPQIPSFQGKHVLLVEDIELNREIAQTILEEHGFEVECAENGAQAVEMVRASKQRPYSVVLMDIQMPVMDGYEATRRIRKLEDSSLAGVTILALTANALEEDKQCAMDAGMNGHIGKPIQVDVLLNEIGKFCREDE